MAKPTVLLYPGAGSTRDHSGLVAIEQELRGAASVERLDFPYRRAGRRAPDRAPKLMASIRDDLATVRRRRGPLVMGGRSMGGRMVSMVAADADAVGAVPRLAGLVLIAYPLHPPAKPDRLRVEHLPAVAVPCLFISGTRDAFAAPEELTKWTATMSAPVEHLWIDGGQHDLKGADDAIAVAVAKLVAGVSNQPWDRGDANRWVRPQG